MLAWYSAVKENTPVAYKAFQAKYSDSLYAKQAMKLEDKPKPVPLTLPLQVIRPVRLLPNVTPTIVAPAKTQDARLDAAATLPAKDAAILPKGVVTLPAKGIATWPSKDSGIRPRNEIKINPRLATPLKSVVTLPPRGVVTLPPKDAGHDTIKESIREPIKPPLAASNGATNAAGSSVQIDKTAGARAQLATPRAGLVVRRCAIDDFGRRVCR
jgi:hypothetical protein